MERLRNGIYATAMNLHILDMYKELEDEELLYDWLSLGVPDGNTLFDNIHDFGDKEDFDELFETYRNLCKNYWFCPNFSKYIEKIKKNIIEMLDNPYYNMI